LDEAEFFIALVPEDLSEEGDVVVFFLVGLDAVDNGGGPLDYQSLQSVPLVKVRVHVLFHGLSGLSCFLAFLVETRLLCVHISH